jgi:hypothetical protein
MTIQDQVILALTMWRENRGGGIAGMQSVANVVMNRAVQRKTSAFVECLRPLQFSSLTAKGDPELTLWPQETDEYWVSALLLAAKAAEGTLEDITGGADLYYAPKGLVTTRGQKFTLPNGNVIQFPDGWNENAVVYTCTIADQVFFK